MYDAVLGVTHNILLFVRCVFLSRVQHAVRALSIVHHFYLLRICKHWWCSVFFFLHTVWKSYPKYLISEQNLFNSRFEFSCQRFWCENSNFPFFLALGQKFKLWATVKSIVKMRHFCNFQRLWCTSEEKMDEHRKEVLENILEKTRRMASGNKVCKGVVAFGICIKAGRKKCIGCCQGSMS